MSILADIVSLALVAIAAAHAVWALRIWWPAKSETALARTVVGSPQIEKMPSPAACWSVVLLLLVGALWVQMPYLEGLRGALVQLGLAAMTVIFVLRGVASFLPALHRLWPEEPFATLNRRVFGPLCLAFGAATGLLLLDTLI